MDLSITFATEHNLIGIVELRRNYVVRSTLQQQYWNTVHSRYLTRIFRLF